MVRDLSNLHHGPQRSSISRDDRDEGGTLKSLMSNLLPSLDASMDSQFAKDFSHSEATATTANQTSYTTSFSSSFRLDDLCDSSDEEDNMSVSTSSRFRAQGAKVKQSLKKAFNKMAKKSSSSLNTASTGSSSGKKTTSKKGSDKKATSKGSFKKDPLALDSSSESKHFIDDVSIDTTFVDPPAPASCPVEEPPALLPQHDHHQSDNCDREKPQRQRSRSQVRPSTKACTVSRSRSPSDRGESESSESNRHRTGHSRAPSSKRSSGAKGKKGELKKRRSSRRGGGGGKSSSTGKRMPPKAKSYDCQRSNPPGLTPMGKLIASGGGDTMEKPNLIRRSSSFASTGRERPRNSRSSVTAQAAIPNPRPSMSAHRRSSAMKQPASGSAHRRRSGDANKSTHRKRSIKHASNNEGHEPSAHISRTSLTRTKSLGKQGEQTDVAKSTRQRPSRAKSFDGCTNMEPIRGSQHRNMKSISTHKREGKRKSASTASRQQDSYSSLHASFNGEEPPPLFSLMDHFGAGSTHTTTTVETKFDEVSIDTCTTAEAAKKIESKGAARRRSKSRSVSPGGRQRSKSRSRSPSEGRHKKREGSHERERSLSRRPSSSHDRGRPQSQKQSRRPSSVARDRSKSVTRRNSGESAARRSSGEKRTRSKSRSRRNGSAERDKERSQSQSRRPSVKPQTRGRSKSVHRRSSKSPQQPTTKSKRPSVSAKRRSSVQRSRSSSRSRRESAAKSFKKYETLSKEDVMQPKDKASAEKGRRARSASRTKESAKSRVSRSLSMTRKSKEQQEGIGDYIQRQQEQISPVIEEDTNSQSTGSKTTESNEVTYATPSWMWNQSSSAASFNSDFFNAHKQDAGSSWASFGPLKEESSTANVGDDGQGFFQTSFTSNSYDADRSEQSTLWSTPKVAT